jgi:hypothetical protein
VSILLEGMRQFLHEFIDYSGGLMGHSLQQKMWGDEFDDPSPLRIGHHQFAGGNWHHSIFCGAHVQKRHLTLERGQARTRVLREAAAQDYP